MSLNYFFFVAETLTKKWKEAEFIVDASVILTLRGGVEGHAAMGRIVSMTRSPILVEPIPTSAKRVVESTTLNG